MISVTSYAANDVALTASWFPNQGVKGTPAYGDPETTTWSNFASVFWYRREGEKNGPNVVPARFVLEPDGRQVRRQIKNLAARTAIALDIENSKETGEVPPAIDEVVQRLTAIGLAAIVYTSHNHKPGDTRYRVIIPLSAEIDHHLPAVEIIARELDLWGVLDTSKIGAASVFFLPSCPDGHLDDHQTVTMPGAPIDAAWLTDAAGRVQSERQAEADRVAEAAHAEAAHRRQAKLAAGFDPDDSLIEKLRSRFDLDSVLTSHGYAKEATRFCHPNSSSGQYGASIMSFSGIERVFSHNGTDPLHADNLPEWCTVKAVDAFDAVVILDFGGNRKKAMVELAQRFGLTKAAERKALAGTIFKLIRAGIGQAAIEAAAKAEGEQLGLSWPEVRQVACWVAAQPREAA
jgi:hypothetical protein